MAIEELIAAKNILKKNIAPSICPPGILANIVGTVINNKGGPANGSKLHANTAGIITNPAKSAANVSNIAVYIAALGILNSFFV